ncbi:hypothetical protein J2S43_006816 [Catenuloplanes nepalensis]|uniref:Histone H1 n=1 Tax=Catenuloplanes nepalensis TaxID=587533 RepID=A0ABT9N3N0_9ACTN|nr:hypothetical protein [Catenuloplanes nepalensis]MDP9798304.1 hypothetical protein [Catenuloplanes nepalensis]
MARKNLIDSINPNEYARAIAEATRAGGGSDAEARANARAGRRDIKAVQRKDGK